MGDKKAQRWARRALSTPRAKVFLSSSKYSLSLGDFGAAGATTAIASVGQMAHHTTSMSAGGGITGKVDVSARFGVARPLDTHTLTCGSSPPLCAIAGSELSFSRWLFAFSLVTTLFFTCEFYLALYGTPLRFELLGRGGGRLALIFLIFSQRWLRLFFATVGGFAYGVSLFVRWQEGLFACSRSPWLGDGTLTTVTFSLGRPVLGFVVALRLSWSWSWVGQLLDVLNAHFQQVFGINKLQSTMLQLAYFVRTPKQSKTPPTWFVRLTVWNFVITLRERTLCSRR